MKKAIFIILFALPIFLMITISIAGRLIVMYIPTPVESIHFETEDGEEVTYVEVGKDKTIKITAVVLPELASNKKAIYTLITDVNDPVCEYVETNGVIEITGLRYSSCKLIAVTDDKKEKAELFIEVIDKNITSISLNRESLTLRVAEAFTLVASIQPTTAVNKAVNWSSENPEIVEVSQLGRVTAKSPSDQPVKIIATSVDGGIEAFCYVTVIDELPLIAFYKIGEDVPFMGSEIHVNTLTINILDYLRFDDSVISLSDIEFKKSVGSGVMNTDLLTVTFSGAASYITIRATVVVDGEQTTATVTFRYVV